MSNKYKGVDLWERGGQWAVGEDRRSEIGFTFISSPVSSIIGFHFYKLGWS